LPAAGVLSVADKLAVRASFLSAEVIAQHPIEALQAHAGSIFLLVVANRRATPDTLNQERLFLLF
jgi:hypothetical protein